MLVTILLCVSSILLVSGNSRRSSLFDLWSEHDEKPGDFRWSQYADTYQEVLEANKYGAQKLVMLNIGKQSEVYLSCWTKWFKDVSDFVYVGLSDNRSNPMIHGSAHFATGSQLNMTLLEELCATYGPFDIIIDRSNHSAEMMAVAMRYLFQCMPEKSYYFIEDVMPVGASERHLAHYLGQTIVDYLSGMFATMHNFWSNDFPVDIVFSGRLKSIQLIGNIVVLEKAPVRHYIPVARGDFRIPLKSVAELQYYTGKPQELLNLNIYIADNNEHLRSRSDAILKECRDLCEEYPVLVRSGSNIDECAQRLKHDAIMDTFKASEEYLYEEYLNSLQYL